MMISFLWFCSSLLIFFSNHVLHFLISMELFSLSLIYIVMLTNNNKLKFFSVFKYYFIQSFFMYSMLVILFFLSFYYYSSMLVMFFMLCKLNIFPSHLWVNEVFLNLELKEIFMLSVLTKIPSLLFMLSFFKSNNIIIFCVMMTLFWTMLSMKGFNHINLLFSFSNLNTSCWLILMTLVSGMNFIIFMLIYMLMMMSFINFNNVFMNKNLMPFSVLNMAGFPLSTMFFLKFIVLYSSNMLVIIILLLLFINSYLIYFYYNYFLIYWSDMIKMYNFKVNYFFIIYLCFCLSIFFFF